MHTYSWAVATKHPQKICQVFLFDCLIQRYTNLRWLIKQVTVTKYWLIKEFLNLIVGECLIQANQCSILPDLFSVSKESWSRNLQECFKQTPPVCLHEMSITRLPLALMWWCYYQFYFIYLQFFHQTFSDWSVAV